MIHPIYERFTERPESLACCTTVTLIHSTHGTITLFLPVEEFQNHIMGVIRGAWINNATILIQPSE